MPQMMPLSWLMLFSFFCLMLISFNVMNYYSPYKLPAVKTSVSTFWMTLSWEW